jgi:hypothetical protein
MIIHVDTNSQLKMLQLKKILFQYPFNFQKTLKIQDAPVMAMGMPGMAAPQVCNKLSVELTLINDKF